MKNNNIYVIQKNIYRDNDFNGLNMSSSIYGQYFNSFDKAKDKIYEIGNIIDEHDSLFISKDKRYLNSHNITYKFHEIVISNTFETIDIYGYYSILILTDKEVYF